MIGVVVGVVVGVVAVVVVVKQTVVHITSPVKKKFLFLKIKLKF
jgi:hypothetical protein